MAYAAISKGRFNLRRPSLLNLFTPALCHGHPRSNADGVLEFLNRRQYWAAKPDQNSVLWNAAVTKWCLNTGRAMSDGRPRGSLWRSRKLIGKEALFVIQEIKRIKNDPTRLGNFMKVHVSRLLKSDLVAVLTELERQGEVFLTLKMFEVVKREDWYKSDMYLFKDMIVMLARNKKMEEATQVWKDMRNEGIEPDIQTYTEVIRGFLQYGSPMDAMNIYEEMKQSPSPPEELPFRVLLKGLFPHPLLRNKVKQDFMEIFPDRHVYDPPEDIFGVQ